METKKTGGLSEQCESLVLCQSIQGIELRGTPLRLAPNLVAFELYHPDLVLHLSEVLEPFRILVHGATVYSGRAVLTSVVRTGGTLVCEANLNECWLSEDAFSSAAGANLPQRFDQFLAQWQRLYKIVPEYKVLIADLQTMLCDMRLWLQQMELNVRSTPTGDRVRMEKELAADLGDSVVGAIDSVWQKFEGIVEELEPEVHPAYRAYLRRQLHPLLLCSPFAYRAFHKPLGYAGDYEMVNMIARDPLEGGSLFAKLVNLWLLRQPPSEAHRNRLCYLQTKLIQETLRRAATDEPVRIFNLACGPALEVQRFLAQAPISDRADFTLVDFNPETLDHTRSALEAIRLQYERRTPIKLIKKSVQQILKESGVLVESRGGRQYNFIYCAGLFDYLSDQVCQRLIKILYGWLAPSGLLLVTNVQASKHFRYSLEFILDWHLVCRDRARVEKILLGTAPGADPEIWNDSTGVNIFVEIRRPKHG